MVETYEAPTFNDCVAFSLDNFKLTFNDATLIVDPTIEPSEGALCLYVAYEDVPILAKYDQGCKYELQGVVVALADIAIR